MKIADSKTRCRTTLLRPAKAGAGDDWFFLVLPKAASAALPSRGMNTIVGTLNGVPFRATLEPDGQRSHWLRVDRQLAEAAGAAADDLVSLEFAPSAEALEPEVPADFEKALHAEAKALGTWTDITTVARRDWIQWINSAKQAETRARRIRNACAMLASGKRRVCCFDRSGIFSKGLSAPQAMLGKGSKVQRLNLGR